MIDPRNHSLVAIRSEWHSDDSAMRAIKVMMTGSAVDEEALRRHVQSSAVGTSPRQRSGPVLLTNAIRFESGDHDGTLIVPWPP